MIVLGNLPGSRYLKDVLTKTTNIIHADGQANQIKRELRILGKPLSVTKMTQHYRVKDRNILLHNAAALPSFQRFYEREFPKKDTFQFASKYFTYIWARAFSGFCHKDVYEWVDTTRIFAKLHDMYLKPGVQEEAHAKAIKDTTMLYYLAGDSPLVDNTAGIYRKWDKYSRSSVLDSISLGGVSIYHDLLKYPQKDTLPMFRDKIDLGKWVSLTPDDRIEAVLERVYSDIANDIIFQGEDVINEEQAIMEYLMKATNRLSDDFFSMYIRIHFDDIMASADLGIVEYIKYAEAKKEFFKY